MSCIESVIPRRWSSRPPTPFAPHSGGTHLGVRAAEAPTSGFRDVVLSVLSRVAPQPSTVDLLIAALDHGATTLKRATKGSSGYGGALSGPADAI